jgi:hypothetical protein
VAPISVPTAVLVEFKNLSDRPVQLISARVGATPLIVEVQRNGRWSTSVDGLSIPAGGVIKTDVVRGPRLRATTKIGRSQSLTFVFDDGFTSRQSVQACRQTGRNSAASI